MIKSLFVKSTWLLLMLLIVLQPHSQTQENAEEEEEEALIFYNELISDFQKPDYNVFKMAFEGQKQLETANKLSDKKLLTIIDFSISANSKRLWVIDLKTKKIIHHTLVAHGRNTGEEYADTFSNISQSHMSSLGFYVTGSTYQGKHGLSLYLDGQERNFNHNARKRAIVMHGAQYVSRSFIKKHGRLGRSWGCPALSQENAEIIIPKLANKTCLFIYHPSQNYLQNSKFIDESH